MLRTMIACLASLFVTSAAFALPAIGQPAPEFKGTDVITGKPVALSDFKGHIVVLEWHNPQCPFIKKFYSSNTMQQMQAKAAKDDIIWVSINSSAEGKEGYQDNGLAAKAMLAGSGSNAAHYLLDHDGSIGHLYGAKTTPHMFVIRKDGTLAYMGAMDDKDTADSTDIATATNYVQAAINALKEGKPVATPVTRPYGCFVKY